MCVVVFVVVRGRAHWRAACSAAGCQGLNRAASEVRIRGENRSRKVMLTLYKSLVRSHLEYCCPLWHPDKIKDI